MRQKAQLKGGKRVTLESETESLRRMNARSVRQADQKFELHKSGPKAAQKRPCSAQKRPKSGLRASSAASLLYGLLPLRRERIRGFVKFLPILRGGHAMQLSHSPAC